MREGSSEEGAASFEAALTLFGTFFPDVYKRFADTARDVQRLSSDLERQEKIRAKERRTLATPHDGLEGDLDALEIESWRRNKIKEIRAALQRGELTEDAAVDHIRAVNDVAAARLDAL